MSTAVLDEFQKYVPGRMRAGAGSNFTGFCPIHGEVPGKSTPSLSINAATGQWFCFGGCGGGNITSFLKAVGRSRKSIDSTVERLKPFLMLKRKEVSPVKKRGLFLTQHPLPERILGLWDAYAPVDLLDDGYDEELLRTHDIGYDVERHRIVFPIRDVEGNLAGIMGRNTRNVRGGRYKLYHYELREMGYPVPPMNKQDYLWRWDKVYPQLYFSDEPPTIYVVEGFKACLWMVQHGYPNTVALMGSSLGRVQKIFFERLGGEIILCLDNDTAGIKGTLKIGQRVKGCRISVMKYPSEDVPIHQPDDLTSEGLHMAINNKISFKRWQVKHDTKKKRTA